ncbi:MAG: helix-turn-helix domain-containing protein [Bacteroidota bacterium]
MKSSYHQIEPSLDVLRPLIKLYYIQQSLDKEAVEKITYFPNYTTTINVYENSKVHRTDLSRTHEYESSDNFLKLLVGKLDRSREIIYKGKYNKLTIVFHPLGLNHFVPLPAAMMIEDHFSFFDFFGTPFDDMLRQVFRLNDIERKRDLLDDFFRHHLLGFEEQRLSYAVNRLLNHTESTTVKTLSDELSISRKTLLRLFTAHLGLSPTAYKSTIRFRKALDIYQHRLTSTNFSALAYEADFYDQSDLNAHFKVKTGLTPKELFAAIQQISHDLYWKVEDVPKVQDIQDGHA